MSAWLTPSIFALVALIFTGSGIYLLIKNIRFRLKAVSTEGEVIAEKPKSGTDGIEFHPVIRFKTPDGKNWTFVNNVGASMGMPKPGKKVTVLYDPERPRNARWDNFVELWLLPLVPIAVGATFLIFTLNNWLSR
jgi:hypothetical protein